MSLIKIFLLFNFSFLLFFACRQKIDENQIKPLFHLLPPQKTNIFFENILLENEELNILNYLYYFNGGGVAIGDINNDGLPDLYFTANLLPNKLYLNKGNLEFEDITVRAGVEGQDGWTTGVTMADVNGDGWIDIYVCQVGNYLNISGTNQLFINNGNNTFTNKAREYGLDHEGFSTQAVFFDYDNDGDLDMYLLNHSVHTERSYGNSSLRNNRDPKSGDKLFRHDISSDSLHKFVDVSEEAGIYGSHIGYGLGVAVGDINKNGCQDIYVSNDFHENDYLYLNNCDGTFTESLTQSIGHTSSFSMGNDLSDFNNDGFLDIIVMDMLPEKEDILKTSAGLDPYDIYQFKLSFGYHYQYPRNTLQLNQGLNPQKGVLFSEIGQIAGVSATDWSWSSLFADLDNDGFKDLFITNGIYRRPNDMDYIKYISNAQIQKSLEEGINANNLQIIEKMPTVKIPNYAYQNNGNLTFTNKAEAWGLDQEAFSNGAAYVDLDNDGDLDLVVNNINQVAFIYENKTNLYKNNSFLKVKLQGEGKNTLGIGAKVTLYSGNLIFHQEQMLTRGFQSSIDPILNFGLGNHQVDSLVVIWPNTRKQVFFNPEPGTILQVNQKDANLKFIYFENKVLPPILEDITHQVNIDYIHKENNFIDFNRELMMPHLLSTEGPKMAVGDINGDGLDDFFIGGAANEPGKIYLQKINNKGDCIFESINEELLLTDKENEDIGALFFDADGDGDLDLYVVSGGNEWAGKDIRLLDRLYLNTGNDKNGVPVFKKSIDLLPELYANGSCIAAADFDNDGDLDLFVGSRSVPWQYGITPESYLLVNDGAGNFQVVTDEIAPGLANIGMVTSAIWADVDNDEKLDLIVVGEWMPITIFKNEGKSFRNITTEVGLNNSNGWYNSILADDFDGDGYIDFVAGNLGLNSTIKAGIDNPAHLYVKDFNKDGKLDQIITYYKQGKSYPMATRDELVNQMVSYKKKYIKHSDYSDSQLGDIFQHDEIQNAHVKEAFTFSSLIIKNKGGKNFIVEELPVEAQFAPIFGLASADYDHDGHQDILLSGNFFSVGPKRGRYDASFGLLLKGDGKGNFSAMNLNKSGFIVTGESRDLKTLKSKAGELYLVSRNNERIQVFKKK
ncbi:VCBS repeat-containing protein [soil metagenome]